MKINIFKATLDSKFNFGKYKGLTIKDVWTGPALNYNNAIKDYFDGLFKFIKTDYDQTTSFVIPHSFPLGYDFERSRYSESNEPFGNFEVIVTNKYLIIQADDNRLINRISTVLQKIYEGSFNIIPTNTLTKKGQGNDTILTECLRVSADPQYILWCIKTVDKFCIDPEEFEKLMQLDSCKLERIIIKEIKTDLLEYEPVYKAFQINIKDDIKEINARKIEYFNELMASLTNEMEYREGRNYGEYAGSYAQDIMGYSDEEIENIFDGFPDAYWNID